MLKSSVTMNWNNPLLLLSLPLASQTAQNPRPNSELKDPDGERVQFKFQTLPSSVQIYTCQETLQGFRWTGPDPDAIMMNGERTLTVHHYKGPTWEATDGSIVRIDSRFVEHFLPNNKDAVHWLELPSKDGTKQFEKVKIIHRSTPPVDSPHLIGPAMRITWALKNV
jgi:hypothetical protein